MVDGMKRTESGRIADQLRRAFDGSAWHGPALIELLEDVDAATAAAKPRLKIHSIWELVLHIAAWDGAALRRLSGEKYHELYHAGQIAILKKVHANSLRG
jgi:uncharacterized damage-inducible protein DinB